MGKSVHAVIDVSNEVESIRRFMQLIDGTDVSVISLDADELVEWDGPDDTRGEARNRIWLETIKAAVENNGTSMILHNSEGILVGLARETPAGKWEVMNIDGFFRQPIATLLGGNTE
jgi:hypothetical protein